MLSTILSMTEVYFVNLMPLNLIVKREALVDDDIVFISESTIGEGMGYDTYILINAGQKHGYEKVQS